jgi:hypothetical protein
MTRHVDWRALSLEVRKHFLGAISVTAEYPGAIHVYFGDPKRYYVAGDANSEWHVDYYDSYDRYLTVAPNYFITTHLSSTHRDPWLVALNIAAAISRHEIEQ